MSASPPSQEATGSTHPNHTMAPAADIRRLGMAEFITLLAFLFATVAFSIDAMLPALPEIAHDLTPQDPNRAQLILTAFMAGMGIGTLISGPLSDAIGRKATITLGFAIYILAALAAIYAPSLEVLLLCRMAQGIGAAGPRIAGLALVRDLYAGREMARISSFVMMVFIMIPAFAPLLGDAIISAVGWRHSFLSFVVFALIGAIWLNLRQPETLPSERRRKLSLTALWFAAREVLTDRQVVICTLVLTLGFAQMFALLSSAQQLFSDTYGIRDDFPKWFALMALLAGTGSIINAQLVVRLGMRRIARAAYVMQIVSSTIFTLLLLSDVLPDALRFPMFFIWSVSVFFMAGITFGNLNALALQRMGHIAGMTASITASVSTLLAVLIAAPIGLAYNGTPIPMAVATLICSSLAWAMMGLLRD
ncbi:MAG: multidrug effflux MFS transporter [Paracoccus sp. (in: a-proteobacteria)]|uniref:multidrug effflux MFS transporter n=1 Tax=Paracoccus sp. TaxID=267 RepID=UPI0026DFC562|nr:multidrug effflux MFS transporter [Paracoccus sp. (in: a-proteobacteria)]MDO5621108.1 multidrug effflux MFS transporter [Paracoccus sp. (in: a-proteobacteria)]